jgi:hypothetical protein
VKKERKGPLGALGGLAEDLAAGMRRRQEEREPRVVVYDSAGHSRVIPEGMERDRILDVADEMIDLTGEAERT